MVTQYHFTAWPDHGVPDAFQLLQFYRKVTGNSTEYEVPPTVVHCRLDKIIGFKFTIIEFVIFLNHKFLKLMLPKINETTVL